ncbi:patatin-domain-containing protein, partial [Piedraia hortae CBS 480.64]
LNMTTLLLLLLAFASTISWIVRYRFLNMYSRLPPEPQRTEPQVEIFPDAPSVDNKPGLASYFDEFLSAIKVFGYLERPVFHELTRTMQTRKLIAGEAILLEEEKGFCLVVDGLVQIFVKANKATGPESPSDGAVSDEEPQEERQHPKTNYQLLTEVKNGAPMSSLFSILALFTENVRLRFDGDYQVSTPASDGKPQTRQLLPAGVENPPNSPRRPRNTSLATISTPSLRDPPPLNLYDEIESPQRSSRKRMRKDCPAHPDIVARASVDTTIAIIPASAFHRITKIYPKATAHIVQVILTRLQRVTLGTGQNYLGLTSEVLRVERLMDKYTTYALPDFLRGEALSRLKLKFKKDIESAGVEQSLKGVALYNPRKRTSSNLKRDVRAARPQVATGDWTGMSAGDLLTNGQSPSERGNLSLPYQAAEAGSESEMQGDNFHHNPRAHFHRQSSLDEDLLFRESIMECMAKAIGMTGGKDKPPTTQSAAQSPRLVSLDPNRNSAIFNNAFGFIDVYDAASEEIESSASVYSVGASSNLMDDLKNEVEIVYFPKGSVLIEEDERNSGLYYLIDGFLDVSALVPESSENADPFGTAELSQDRNKWSRSGQKNLFSIKPGGLAGYLGSISSYRSLATVTAKTDVFVGFLPKSAVERIVERYPIVLLTMAKRMASLLPRLIQYIDFALEWVHVNAGQAIFNQNEESDAIYIVLNGRLRGIVENEKGDITVVGEFGQGDSVGELEVLTESTRSGTFIAIRDTELIRFPKTLFNSLAQDHPGITIKVSKMIAARMRKLIESPEPVSPEGSIQMRQAKATSTTNLRTVAVVPCTSGVPVVEFANKLQTALNEVGTMDGAITLNQAAILNHLGRYAFGRMGKLKLSQYLADLEEKYGFVLYVADTSVKSPWTQTCISQADCIYLIGLAEGSPAIGEYERLLLTVKTTARKELVLLHSERYCSSGTTRAWLKNRPWVNGGHHHVQMAIPHANEHVHVQPRRLGNAIKQRVQVLQAEIHKYTSRRVRQRPLYSADTPFKGDFHRLARRLCGKAVGLVLGGGGARGCAQIGVIRALEECGIPIDMVGGTSIGAFVGAVYAQDGDLVPMYGRVKKFAGRMGSIWRFALDITYPTTSYTTGHEFNRGIFKTFGNCQIEDFWLSYYCNSTNISKSRSEYHSSGYVWRYVRASMSLAGLLPPLCDEGDMLLDGGYTDNLTVSHMRSLGADVIFAIDVGALDSDIPQTYGDSLSGLWALVNRWNFFSTRPNPPTLSEIQARLAYVSSVDALERAKGFPGCRYLRPPVEGFGTLEFGRFDEIYRVGYEYGKNALEEMRIKGELPRVGKR